MCVCLIRWRGERRGPHEHHEIRETNAPGREATRCARMPRLAAVSPERHPLQVTTTRWYARYNCISCPLLRVIDIPRRLYSFIIYLSLIESRRRRCRHESKSFIGIILKCAKLLIRCEASIIAHSPSTCLLTANELSK